MEKNLTENFWKESLMEMELFIKLMEIQLLEHGKIIFLKQNFEFRILIICEKAFFLEKKIQIKIKQIIFN